MGVHVGGELGLGTVVVSKMIDLILNPIVKLWPEALELGYVPVPEERHSLLLHHSHGPIENV